jgi:S1-C subfamily serine protease
LVNEYGEVVGINSIGMTTSSTVQFSVPINQVKDAITSLANGKVRGAVICETVAGRLATFLTPLYPTHTNNRR